MDILERLKRGDVWYVNESLQESIDRLNRERIEAADEIERLKGANRAFAEQVTNDYKEIKRLREALRKAGAAVERLAFKMPPPNVWTPQFVQLGQQIARSALQQKDSE